MSPRFLISLFVVFACACLIGPADAQEAQARPGGPLVCHKEVCPLPASSCQVRESDRCLHGGGPPRCPAIINAANGTACNDANVCTTGDVCSAGVCGGTAVSCSSSSDVCTPSAGCATACGPSGCVVAAAGGFMNPTLTVPAGALSSAININMTDLGADAGNPAVFRRYNFAPNGTGFSIPATVNLPAPPLVAGQIAIIEVSNDGTNWAAIATTASAGRVSGPIAHFSQCRTRAAVAPAAVGLLILDAVSYQDVTTPTRPSRLAIPPSGESGTCQSDDDLFGICLKLSNPTSSPITSSCPVPTPSPAPAGCQQLRVVPWQCYAAYRNSPPIDPGNPLYEGQRCDRVGGFVIPCAQAVYNLEQLVPGGSIPANTDIWVDLNFEKMTAAGGTSPKSPVCFGSTFMGFDLLFREPSGSCPAGGGSCDWQAGIRSAKVGPFISVAAGTQVYVPPGEGGCPIGGATCQGAVSCGGAATCKVEWGWLVNRQPANYPTLRFTTPSGEAKKNWLLDTRE